MQLRKQRKTRSQINMTSLIDVMFILLLFFVVTSTFKELNNSALDLVLPQTQSANQKSADENEITLFLAKNKRINILNVSSTVDSLQYIFPTLKDRIQGKTLLLKGDENADYQSFITVFDVLKLNGIESIILLSKEKK